jgi:hypothetical protein
VQLRDAALTFDRRLRRGIGGDQLAELEGLLDRLATNSAYGASRSIRQPPSGPRE